MNFPIQLMQFTQEEISFIPWILYAVLAVSVILFFTIAGFVSLWFQALVSGTPIPLFNIIGMSLRKIPPRIIVNARINSFKAGLKISVDELETHYLAGGNVPNVVLAMIAANKAQISLDWGRATAIDLAGRDVVDAVRTSVHPKVIDCPDGKKQEYIVGVSKDGIQLKVQVRVTVRTNIDQLVGGATEETIIARVGEGIVSAIGAAEDYKMVLESPQDISKKVLGSGLDSSTAFKILSVDIVRIDVGDNTGAGLNTSKAEALKIVAQAEAEARRAMGVAVEQENAAALMAARAKVPEAMADALRAGTLGVFDYYRLQNMDADTTMREKIGGKELLKEIKKDKK